MIMQFFLTVEDLKKMMTDCAHDDHLTDDDDNDDDDVHGPI